MSLAVEIAVDDEEGLVVAARAGADRVELCEDLARGGLTPPAELVERCARRAAALVEAGDARPQFDVHVLLREDGDADFLDRPGEFVLDDAATARLAQRAAEVVEAGAAGIVLGALIVPADPAESPRLDVERMAILRDAGLAAASRRMRGVTLTCHRALDALPDAEAREEAMRVLIGLGFHRALTSGGAARAIDGAEDLARMVEAGEDLVAVCAGGGVRPAHLAELARRTGVHDVHLSARTAGRAPENGTLTDAAVATAAVDAAGAM